MSSLEMYGWTASHEQSWGSGMLGSGQPARVVADFGTSLKVAMPEVVKAELSGKLAHYAARDNAPKVGDWVRVLVSPGGSVVIESVMLRANEIARKVAGKRTQKQIIATNVDIAFVLLALDEDFSVERLRRFLYQLSVGKIAPVIVLNKADKAHDMQSYVAQVEQFGVPIVTAAAADGVGVSDIAAHILPGKTAILLGSSGVGKSTLTNQLLGRDAQATGEVRESDATGRHTTVHRELFVLPGGGLLIDAPGIRELQLWGTEEDLEADYADIIALVRQCRFSNCQHTVEQGCAVTAALANGTLSKKHYENYTKLKHELAALAEKTTEKARRSGRRPVRRGKSKVVRHDDF